MEVIFEVQYSPCFVALVVSLHTSVGWQTFCRQQTGLTGGLTSCGE